MIQAEIHGKISERQSLSVAERSEDVLTSSVFGLLRYMPPFIVHEFLTSSLDLEEDPLELPETHHINFTFWPHPKRWKREPDVVLDLSGPSGLIVRIVIEAKYRSGKSDYRDDVTEEEPDESLEEAIEIRDQLAEQYDDALTDYEQNRIQALHPPALIYLTAHFSYPREAMLESKDLILERHPDHSPPRLYWLGWWKLADVLRKNEAILEDEHFRMIAKDLLFLLKRRGQSLLHNAWSPNLDTSQLLKWTFRVPEQDRWWGVPCPTMEGAPWIYTP